MSEDPTFTWRQALQLARLKSHNSEPTMTSESKDPMTPAERAQFDKDIRLVRDNKPKGFRDTLIHAGNCVGADLVIIHSTRRLYSVVSIEPRAINQEYCASNSQVITAPTTSGMCVEIVRAIRRMEATMKAVNDRKTGVIRREPEYTKCSSCSALQPAGMRCKNCGGSLSL